MAYIGKTPVIGNFVKLDSITVVNGQAAYTMQNGGVNFTSYDNVNQFLVSLNGVLQAPTDSFTVSSSTLTFASNLSTGDVIDFVLVLGNSLDIGTPSDNTVSLAKLTATGTKDSTTFLRGDNTFAVPTDNGKVLQVIHGSTTTSVTSSSSTEVSTGVTAQITPSSTSNKVLVFGSINGIQIGSATSTGGAWKIRRHDTSTSATSGTNIQSIVNYGGYDNAASDHQYALSFNDLDSPSTTAARNYTITFNRNNGSGSIQVQNNSATSSITLMEIVG
jgi:hypothetical protein